VLPTRACGITRQLLDFGCKHEPKKIPCNLNELLTEIAGGLKQKEFSVSNIELNMNLQPDLPDTLVDPDQIRQVFLNLANNAGDAISGPGSITITTRSDDPHVAVIIEDTGEGMTSEELEKIFDPFYTTKEVGKGTGLGLSISLSIIESVDGRMDVKSPKSRGSTFTLAIPISDSDQS
jgi:two-component system NtrC family sensor kinase